MLSPNCCQMLSVQEVAAGRLRQSFRVVQASFVEPRHVLQTPLIILKIALNLLSLGFGSGQKLTAFGSIKKKIRS